MADEEQRVRLLATPEVTPEATNRQKELLQQAQQAVASGEIAEGLQAIEQAIANADRLWNLIADTSIISEHGSKVALDALEGVEDADARTRALRTFLAYVLLMRTVAVIGDMHHLSEQEWAYIDESVSPLTPDEARTISEQVLAAVCCVHGKRLTEWCEVCVGKTDDCGGDVEHPWRFLEDASRVDG